MKGLIANDIAKLIRESREKKKWNQAKLASMLGFKKGQGQMVSNIERGVCNLPPKYCFKVSEVLDIDLETIVVMLCSDYKKALLEEIRSSGAQKI